MKGCQQCLAQGSTDGVHCWLCCKPLQRQHTASGCFRGKEEQASGAPRSRPALPRLAAVYCLAPPGSYPPALPAWQLCTRSGGCLSIMLASLFPFSPALPHHHPPPLLPPAVDNQKRFSMFCRAAIESLRALPFMPGEDCLMVCNDWHTAPVPVLLNSEYKKRGEFVNTKSALCIHNIAFQGRFWRDSFGELGLPAESADLFDFNDGYPKVFDERTPADEAATVRVVCVCWWAPCRGGAAARVLGQKRGQDVEESRRMVQWASLLGTAFSSQLLPVDCACHAAQPVPCPSPH